MPSKPPEICRRIREIREARGLSQEDAAHLLGVSVKAYRNWETFREPSLERLRQIAKALDAELVIELRPR